MIKVVGRNRPLRRIAPQGVNTTAVPRGNPCGAIRRQKKAPIAPYQLPMEFMAETHQLIEGRAG